MERFKKIKKQSYIIIAVAGLVFFGLGFWAGYDYKAKEVRDALADAFSIDESSDDLTEQAEAQELDDFDEITYGIGEEIEYATINMKVNSARSDSIISSEFSRPLVAEEGTKFVIINQTVTNTTNSPYSFESFFLFDQDDRRYNSSSDAFGYIDNLIEYDQISPGVPLTGVTVFKVPADTTSFKYGAPKGSTSELHVVEFEVE